MSINKKLNVTGLLGYKLKKTQHALRLNMDEVLKGLNLTTPQYAVLAQIELSPGISNAALARSAFITAQTMHGIVSHLESRKLIKRDNNPQNSRILETTLTAKGKKIVQKAHALIAETELRMTKTLSHEKKILLEQLLIECFDNLHI